jgi:hypothetical protein
MIAAAAILASAAAQLAPGASAPISLVLPLACEVGRTCFIQHYVDHDPGEGSKDYRCGPKTYDKHDGIDFRLPDMAAEKAGVKVLAAAPGVVLRSRDGVADVSVRIAGKAAVKDKECGNGLVIAHANGWETQYCHMKMGSLVVHPGDKVSAGQMLGEVGLSGDTEFPHLHLTVRQDGKVVDPFDYGAPLDSCGAKGRPLWSAQVAKSLSYQAPEVINAGFAGGPISAAKVDSGEVKAITPSAAAPALVAYVRTIGLEAGDVLSLSLFAPDGSALVARSEPPLDHSKAQYLVFAGVPLKGARWPSGKYRAQYEVTRAGARILVKSFELTL